MSAELQAELQALTDQELVERHDRAFDMIDLLDYESGETAWDTMHDYLDEVHAIDAEQKRRAAADLPEETP